MDEQVFKRSDNSNPTILFQFRTLDGFFCPSLSSKVYFSAGRISPNRGLATYDQPELALLLYQILACTSNATFWLKAAGSYRQVQKKKCGWIQNCGKCESHFGRHFPDVKGILRVLGSTKPYLEECKLRPHFFLFKVWNKALMMRYFDERDRDYEDCCDKMKWKTFSLHSHLRLEVFSRGRS